MQKQHHKEHINCKPIIRPLQLQQFESEENSATERFLSHLLNHRTQLLFRIATSKKMIERIF